jgi:hypothetical protein
MKFSLWRQYGALNSKPIFDAFERSLCDARHDVVYNSNDADINVIWSVLWNGRMSGNEAVWKNDKPTIVLEVGGIKRGTTWKVALNGINRDAYFGESGNDNTRADLLGLKLNPWQDEKEGDYILLCGQHDKSHQWRNMPRMSTWFLQTYEEIRKHTDRPILFRPHPRCRLPEIERGLKNVYRRDPIHISGTYDDFDMSFHNIYATISYCSNPGPHSILAGVPAFVGPSSLAYDVSNDIDFLHDINSPLKPDRTQWLNDYAWTEFTREEIEQGIPLKRLTSRL